MRYTPVVRRSLLILAAALALGLAALALWRTEPRPAQGPLLAPAPASAQGFARAQPGYRLTFPRDFGPHPEYQSEWWYYTGNLQTDDGRRFGFELTFFRRSLVPPDHLVARPSGWATSQVYMAHLALTDVAGRRYRSFERLARGAAGLAGAEAKPYHVWLEDWSVLEEGLRAYRLQAAQDGIAIDLMLQDSKGPIAQGENGYSRKGADPGNASYYVSQTRLAVLGTVRSGETTANVSGLAWMDHEWSTSALSGQQIGWDWFSIQLDDGSELMLYNVRNGDGSLDPFSSGAFIPASGAAQRLAAGEFRITAQSEWRSPHSGALYPASWQVEAPLLALSLSIEPYLADQELRLSYTYWEGAVRVMGNHAGKPITGSGYVELTGYAAPMQNTF